MMASAPVSIFCCSLSMVWVRGFSTAQNCTPGNNKISSKGVFCHRDGESFDVGVEIVWIEWQYYRMKKSDGERKNEILNKKRERRKSRQAKEGSYACGINKVRY